MVFIVDDIFTTVLSSKREDVILETKGSLGGIERNKRATRKE